MAILVDLVGTLQAQDGVHLSLCVCVYVCAFAFAYAYVDFLQHLHKIRQAIVVVTA